MGQYLDDNLIEGVKKDIAAAISKSVFFEVMGKLDDQGREECAKMIEEENDPKKIEEFLRSKIENYDKIAEKVEGDFFEMNLAV